MLGEKAMLLRSVGARAYGMLFRVTHKEMDTLYVNLHEYRAEPFQACLENGDTVVAVSMVHIDPPIDSKQDPIYAARFKELIQRLGLPSTVATHES